MTRHRSYAGAVASRMRSARQGRRTCCGVTGPFSATKENDLDRIQVRQERHDVVEAVIFGG